MHVVNQRSYALVIDATGVVAEPGVPVEVPDDLGKSLLEQPDNWAAAKPSKKETSR